MANAVVVVGSRVGDLEDDRVAVLYDAIELPMNTWATPAAHMIARLVSLWLIAVVEPVNAEAYGR